MKEDCIFCKIANGVIPTNLVYENDFIAAFNDLNPKASTHILVVPKKHFDTLNDIDDEKILLELFKGVQDIAIKLNLDSIFSDNKCIDFINEKFVEHSKGSDPGVNVEISFHKPVRELLIRVRAQTMMFNKQNIENKFNYFYDNFMKLKLLEKALT